ncbi:HD domain-containing protein [Candidatus Beckwithbacteria bacterium]|nr:HD domain-containing protein [Candidatus Beckwithbacteria bacterium]
MNQKIISKTKAFVKNYFAKDTTGHDYAHTYRVWQMARKIYQKEKQGDLRIIELAALLHDVGDWKKSQQLEYEGASQVKKWLEKLAVKQDAIDHIIFICQHISFKGAEVENKITSIEGKIVQDADRLEAMGAIGIARTFIYGGAVGRSMHDPTKKPVLASKYIIQSKEQSTTINHFYEKLLLLKNRMHTKTAKKLAQGRHEFMQAYLKQFYKEWEGKA